MYVYVYMQLHVEATADASAPTYFLRQGLSLNLKLSNLAGMRLEIPLKNDSTSEAMELWVGAITYHIRFLHGYQGS